MASNELIKPDEPRGSDMTKSRSSLVNRLSTPIYLLMCHISYYLIHYSSAFLMILYLLNITISSLILQALAVASILAFIYNYQDSLLYYPNSPADSRLFVEIPSKFGLPYEDFFIQTRDEVSLHAYLIKQPMPNNAFTVVFLHGNAGNIGHRLMNAQLLYQNCRTNVMLVEYRGFGRSKGSPSEEGLLLDAATAIEYLASRADLNAGKIVLFGRSLGGAVAVGTACLPSTEGRVAGLIVENTFTSITDMAKALFRLPIFDYWPNVFVKNKFVSLEKIARVQVPILFISGLQDELVPPSMMRILFERSRGVLKRLFLCQNGTHNDSWRCPGYYEQINSFLNEIEEFKQGREIRPSQVFAAPHSS